MIESRYPLRPLGEVLRLDRDEVPVEPTETYRTAGIYSFGRGLFEREPILGSETSYPSLFRLHEGQVAISRLNGWEGALDVVLPELDGTFVSNEYPTFSVRDRAASVEYLTHLIRWPPIWDALRPRGSMVRRRRVHPDDFLALEVPIPDPEEQVRVSRRVSSALEMMGDVGIAAGRSANVVEGAVHSAVLAAQARSPLTATRLGDILSQGRGDPVEVVGDRSYRAIGIRAFGRGLIRYPSKPGTDLGKLRFFAVPEGALAISNIKAWEGAVTNTVDIEPGLTASNRFLFYKPISRLCDVRYIQHVLLSDVGLRALGRASPGSADRNRTLAASRFEQIELPLPSPEVQHEVGSLLDRLHAPLADLDDHMRRRSDLLAALERSILNRAFAGLM